MTDDDFKSWLKSSSSIRTLLVVATVSVGGSNTTIYMSSRAYTSGASDSPANTLYLPCVNGGVSFTETLSLDGKISVSYGDIEIVNRGGMRDSWLDYVWKNGAVQVYLGDIRWPLSSFRKMFDGVMFDIGSRDADTLNITIMNKLQRLNNPAVEELLGGITDNKDKQIPTTLGEVHNITPLLIDPGTKTFKVHGGAIEDIIEVRDNGAPTEVTKDLANGTFTLVKNQVGTITCSVQGDKPGGVYSNDIADLIKRVATGYGPTVTRMTLDDIDLANFSAFSSAHTQPIGVFSESRLNILNMCQDMASSVGAQLTCPPEGKLKLVRLELPPVGTPVIITADDIDFKKISISSRSEIKAACKLGYCKNWTVQASGLALGLPPENLSMFAQEWLTVTEVDTGLAAQFKLDTNPEQLDTLLLVEADAQAEALRRKILWGTQRTVFEVKCRPHMILTQLGDAITLQHKRFGLSNGHTGIVIKVSRDWFAGRITLGVLV
jgi:hypothetical protein